MKVSKHTNAGQWLGWLAVLLWLVPAAPLLAQDDDAWELDYRDWKEDPERVERYSKTCLSAAEYAQAIKATGQSIHAGPKDAGGPWVPTGPTGDFAGAPFNGRTTGIFVRDNVNDYTVYVGACAGGLWKADSSDGVGVWTSIGDALPNPSVRAFAQAPNWAQKFLVGTGDHRRYGGGGLYKTTNEGITWTEIPLYNQSGGRVYPNYFFRIVYRPDDPNTVYAACSSGIFVSSDGGDTWTQSVEGNVTDLVLHPTNPDIQYACIYGYAAPPAGSGLYYTDNAWNTYSLFTHPVLPTGDDFDRASIAVCRDHPANLALVVETENEMGGVFVSTNSGSSWIDVTSQDLIDAAGDQVWHAQAITFRPDNPSEIYVGAINLARTLNGGATWTINDFPIGHADITQLHFSEATGDDVLWICNDGGIYRYEFGDTTVPWNGDAFTGLRTSQIDFMDAQRSFRTIGLQDNGLVYRPEGIPDWTYYGGGDGFGVRITDVLANEWWFCDGIYGDDPTTRVYRVTGMPPTDEYTYNVVSNPFLFFDRESDQMFSMGEDTLWSTPVFGPLPGWTDEPVTIGSYGKGDRGVFGSRLDAETLYVNYWTYGDGMPAWLSVCRRQAGTWNIDHHQLSTISGGVTAVFASTENAAESWAGLIGNTGCPRLLHTTDYWNSGEDLTNELADVGRVDAIAVTPFNPEQIFVGTDIGVFWSENGGQSWAPFQTGMPIVRVTALIYLPRETSYGYDKLVAATYGRGMFERPINGPAIKYVDQSHTDTELGSFEYPYNTLTEGLGQTPSDGLLGLRGAYYYVSTPMDLDQPMEIHGYDGAVEIR